MYSSNSFLFEYTCGIQKFEKVDIKEEEFIQIVTKNNYYRVLLLGDYVRNLLHKKWD
jgi:hypothetical protein